MTTPFSSATDYLNKRRQHRLLHLLSSSKKQENDLQIVMLKVVLHDLATICCSKLWTTLTRLVYLNRAEPCTIPDGEKIFTFPRRPISMASGIPPYAEDIPVSILHTLPPQAELIPSA